MALKDHKELIATLATIVTIAQFLSGIEICRKIVKQGATGEISGFPFVVGVFSCSMWVTFTYLLGDMAMLITNSIGFMLQAIYLAIYLHYCISPGSWYSVRRQMVLLFSTSAAMLYYVFFTARDPELAETRVGLMCCFGSIIFSASPLFSVAEVFKTHCTECLPFPLILSTFIVTCLWWMYGLILKNGFVQYPNLIGFCLASFQLTLFLVFPSKRKGEKGIYINGKSGTVI
ncbi:unnamed protein product [Meganyctiphanes norvegica]|uniref:Sugar transporter SWEET n=1 Tax=Meganyctiphanes norvegica TaxID=48144 RepID=A0AAV2SE01_MEGNR